MARNANQILVGIDAGGSKTHIKVASAHDGTVLGDKILESTGWTNLDDAQRADALLSMVETVATPLGDVAVVVAGVHGNDSPEQEAVLRAPLAARFPLVRVLNDSHLLILAYGKQSGTGVIAGTGSSVTATSDEGVITVGGWGWILGDEGGATGIVRDAAKQVLEAYDRGEQDTFSTCFLSHFDLEHPHGLAQIFATIEPRIWATAASLVFDAAQAGSSRAQAVIDRHGRALAEQVALLQQRNGDVDIVVCAGGVIVSQPSLFDAFTREVRRLVGETTKTALLHEPPVIGALNCARQLYATSQKGIIESELPLADRILI
ncbi:BadF/BadG/BcrA/BcrD ATPase family protein [Brucella sp. BE17]|uniref:N-acetylglucosamine kinase n=1 Tax=Brucella sp. BE17 TaxID=3142977 RepID=UPI0031B9EF96